VNRRNALVISVLLALGAGVMMAAVLTGDGDGSDVSVDSNPAVVELLPPRGDTILPQGNVGIILAAGWMGELVHIDGTVIPLDQQRIEPALNSVIFRPDDGLVLDRLPPQQVCTRARYWPVRNPDRIEIFDWCFRVDG